MELSDIKTTFKILFNRPKGTNHKERLESFYQNQAWDYDRYRKKLLHGKDDLFHFFSDWSPQSWCDVGCGTAENLERAAKYWDVSALKDIDLVDLSDSLLSVADKRVKDMGLKNASIHSEEAGSFLSGHREKYDLITFSYSLSMMPEWIDCLLFAKQALKPGGRIAVVDFYVGAIAPDEGEEQHSKFTRKFWPWWFQNDGVFLRENLVPFLKNLFGEEIFLESYGGLPFLRTLQVPYFIFHGEKVLESPE